MSNAIIIACIIFFILFLLIYIRGKRPSLYFAVIFLILALLIISDRFINDTGRSVIFSDDPRHTVRVNGSSMYSALRSQLKNTVPVFIGDNATVVLTETPLPALTGNIDTGIDTVIIEDDTALVIIKAFTGNEIRCSITALYSDRTDTLTAVYGNNSIPSKGLQNIHLICDDDNPYNEYWPVNETPHYLVCTSTGPRHSQRMAFELGSLYHEASFSSGYISNGRILALKKNYEGYIIIGNADISLPDSAAVLHLKAFSIPEVGRFLRAVTVNMRIKNPFSPEREFNVNNVSVKSGLMSKVLVTAFTVMLSVFLVLII